MISVKMHDAQGEKMLAACDEALLGKTLSDDEREIEIHLSEKFYGLY